MAGLPTSRRVSDYLELTDPEVDLIHAAFRQAFHLPAPVVPTAPAETEDYRA